MPQLSEVARDITVEVESKRRRRAWWQPRPLELILLLWAALASGAVAHALHKLSSAVRDHGREASAWSEKTADLRVQTEALTNETSSLRQLIASNATQDVIFLKTMLLKPDIDPTLARLIATHVHRYAELYGRDANLVLAIIAVESRFDPKATSPVGALGLMQVMPQWKKVLGITGDLTDPETSIKSGLQILGFYTEMYKDLGMALTAYNRGPGQVDLALRNGKDPGNGYAPKVLQAYERLKKLTVSAK
jgi:hypothetical protein